MKTMSIKETEGHGRLEGQVKGPVLLLVAQWLERWCVK